MPTACTRTGLCTFNSETIEADGDRQSERWCKKSIGCNYEIGQETGCPKNWEYSSERLKVSHQSVLNTCVVVCSVLCSLTMISSTLYTAAKMSGWVNPRMRADCSHSQVLLAAERARVRHHGTKHRSPQKRQQQARQNDGVVKTQGPSNSHQRAQLTYIRMVNTTAERDVTTLGRGAESPWPRRTDKHTRGCVSLTRRENAARRSVSVFKRGIQKSLRIRTNPHILMHLFNTKGLASTGVCRRSLSLSLFTQQDETAKLQ